MPNWKVPHLRRSIGTVFQDFKLLPTKTVYENVAFAMEVTGKHRSVIRNQVPQVLKLVGLSAKADRLPRQLSGGEQQRVAVARAFVNRPLILLADEPTGNLDPATSVGIMRILDRINRTGTTVVMATHDHAIVDAMKRRVVQLDRGRLMRDESRGIYETREVAAVAATPSPASGTRSPEPASEVATPEDSRLTAEEEQELAHLEEESFDAPDIMSAEELEAGSDPDAAVSPSDDRLPSSETPELASADAEVGVGSQLPKGGADDELPSSQAPGLPSSEDDASADADAEDDQ